MWVEMFVVVVGFFFEFVVDDLVYDYEKMYLLLGVWLFISWYVDWICGFDVFIINVESCLIEMCWLVF